MPSIAGHHGLICLGGPQSVNSIDNDPYLAQEIELISLAISRNYPLLGICLGSQLIAKHLGATVAKLDYSEIGWHTIKSVNEPTGKQRVFQWHQEAYDCPERASNLFLSENGQCAGFSFNANVLAVQFHPEMTVEKASVLKNDFGVPIEFENTFDDVINQQQLFYESAIMCDKLLTTFFSNLPLMAE